MSYVKDLGYSIGPLQIQFGGPIIEYENKESNNFLKIYRIKAEKDSSIDTVFPFEIETNPNQEPVQILIKTPNYGSSISENAIPNIKWIRSYIADVLQEGIPDPGPVIDLTKYVTIDSFNELQKQVTNNTNNVADLQKTTENVKIIVEWKAKVDQDVWILDGGSPDGSTRYISGVDV